MAIPSLVTKAARHQRVIDRLVVLSMTVAILLPGMAMADGDATGNICSVLNTVNKLLNAASVIVVTIAVIFSGYQVAFAHKRISDVAPALIGGVLIGAAAQIAKMVVGGSGEASACAPTQNNQLGMLMDGLHTAAHVLQHYA